MKRQKWMVRLQMLATMLVALIALFAGSQVRAGDFLEPEQAFKLTAEALDAKTVRLTWKIAKDYHLYRDRLSFNAADGAQVAAPVLPNGIRKFDTNFNKEMETYQDTLVIDLPVAAKQPYTLLVGYQGCADAGLCYSPAEQSYRVDPRKPGKLTPIDPAAPAATNAASAAAPASVAATGAASTPAAAPEDDSSLAQRTLQSGSAWRIGLAFLVFGLLLSFTPCVLPMVPILSSIIVGEGNVSRGRGFMLALAYSLGMALVYTSLGVGAGLAGEGLAAALQKPWVLLTFGALLFILSLSMFDVYQLQLPSSLQSRLSSTSGNMGGGKFAGVFVMGALSALIVGPCVAGPLAGALLYISQTRNVWTGGWALFSMAVGMSVPLLLTGLSAGSLLPRAGAWMNGVKKVFGLLLIAVAIWMVTPVFSVTVMMVMWGVFALLCAMFLHVFDGIPKGAGLGAYVGKTLGLAFLLVGLFELTGAASAGRDVLQPLGHLTIARAEGGAGGAGGGAADGGEAHFTRIKTVAELDRVLATSAKPVMLDFYADWCVACKEMERFTFSTPAVNGKMKEVTLLQVDVTANNADDKALMKRFGLFGPPGLIFFNGGKEIPNSRVIGFMKAEPFLEHLNRQFAS
ncbi:thiol:disulfide interchange protein DsbD [Duganella sp. CF517]|uniref:protein-disulfide reductase DsbD n=1 Tax=Duganella sp. CF517 TaxID=1881038 RepID=UPI0008D243B8|nr:protein-disulfide reductase DsbD [Duganella sp. CF517]SEO45265.1 thiol:disulfide interchange protein DsbD [Duganella sp. CF517]